MPAPFGPERDLDSQRSVFGRRNSHFAEWPFCSLSNISSYVNACSPSVLYKYPTDGNSKIANDYNEFLTCVKGINPCRSSGRRLKPKIERSLGLPAFAKICSATLRSTSPSFPKAEHDTPEWQAAMEALLLVAERDGPTMFARIGVRDR
jgi:hypothetical protein